MSQLVSIDDIQEKFDKLVLLFFDSVRIEIGQNPAPSFHKILESYNEMLASIEKLNGINLSQPQQVDKLSRLSAQYEDAKNRINVLEQQLMQLGKQVDGELEISC